MRCVLWMARSRTDGHSQHGIVAKTFVQIDTMAFMQRGRRVPTACDEMNRLDPGGRYSFSGQTAGFGAPARPLSVDLAGLRTSHMRRLRDRPGRICRRRLASQTADAYSRIHR